MRSSNATSSSPIAILVYRFLIVLVMIMYIRNAVRQVKIDPARYAEVPVAIILIKLIKVRFLKDSPGIPV